MRLAGVRPVLVLLPVLRPLVLLLVLLVLVLLVRQRLLQEVLVVRRGSIKILSSSPSAQTPGKDSSVGLSVSGSYVGVGAGVMVGAGLVVGAAEGT